MEVCQGKKYWEYPGTNQNWKTGYKNTKLEQIIIIRKNVDL